MCCGGKKRERRGKRPGDRTGRRKLPPSDAQLGRMTMQTKAGRRKNSIAKAVQQEELVEMFQSLIVYIFLPTHQLR